ncbi:MAG: ABC transporter substrate-binding protein [Candidatus Omnitrophica bacterium]|nr:ABC transporter substrate-binding protein [Candidatus Omnitrophota bacterium]
MRVIIFTLLIMLTLTVTGNKGITKQDKPYGGILVWGTRNKPTIINPLFTTSSVSMSLLDLIFNRLVRIGSKGEIEPDLAESWDISSDGLVYTFYLRKGVRFHDGVECTADDVKFTYESVINPKNNSPFNSLFESVNDFKVIDKYTFQIILKKPSSPFIYRLVREITPKHILEGADLRNCNFNFHPIGTGPFRFKEWGKDNQIILEYNPGYYEGRPYLDRIIVKVYPDSRDLWTGLMRGEVDYATFIEREDYEVIRDDPAFKAYAFPVDIYYALFYNLDDPLLTDKRIREAIAYGIDRKALIEKVAYGYGMECVGPFYPKSLGFNPEVLPFEYNPQKSLELLREAGWKDKDNDGILEKRGEELELRVLVDTRSEIYQRIIMAIRQQLQQIGIKVKVILYDNEDMLTEEFLKNLRVQAHLKLFMAGRADDIEEEWYSKYKRGGKLWVYEDEEVNKLFELGEISQDKKKRQEIYQKINQLIYEKQPAAFLYFPFVFHVVSAKLANTNEYFTLSMPTYTMKDWYMRDKIESKYFK